MIPSARRTETCLGGWAGNDGERPTADHHGPAVDQSGEPPSRGLNSAATGSAGRIPSSTSCTVAQRPIIPSFLSPERAAELRNGPGHYRPGLCLSTSDEIGHQASNTGSSAASATPLGQAALCWITDDATTPLTLTIVSGIGALRLSPATGP